VQSLTLHSPSLILMLSFCPERSCNVVNEISDTNHRPADWVLYEEMDLLMVLLGRGIYEILIRRRGKVRVICDRCRRS
jgi:hypothetical protein